MKRLIGFVKPGGGMRVFDVSDPGRVGDVSLPDVVCAQRPEDNPVALVKDMNLGYVQNVVNFEFLQRAKSEGDSTLMARLRSVGR